jgi:hypothetical protein
MICGKKPYRHRTISPQVTVLVLHPQTRSFRKQLRSEMLNYGRHGDRSAIPEEGIESILRELLPETCRLF